MRRRLPLLSRSGYEAMLREECERLGVAFAPCAAGDRKNEFTLPRWRVWQRLRAGGYSLPAIGTMAGADHSSVLYALRHLPACEARWFARREKELAASWWRSEREAALWLRHQDALEVAIATRAQRRGVRAAPPLINPWPDPMLERELKLRARRGG